MTDAPPEGYQSPVLIYVVEASDESGDEWGQIGGFFTEAEANELLELWTSEGRHGRINVVPIHRRVADWEYDR